MYMEVVLGHEPLSRTVLDHVFHQQGLPHQLVERFLVVHACLVLLQALELG